VLANIIKRMIILLGKKIKTKQYLIK